MNDRARFLAALNDARQEADLLEPTMKAALRVRDTLHLARIISAHSTPAVYGMSGEFIIAVYDRLRAELYLAEKGLPVVPRQRFAGMYRGSAKTKAAPMDDEELDSYQQETPTFGPGEREPDRYSYDAEGHKLCHHCADPLNNFDLGNNEDGVCFGCFYDADHR